MAKKDFNVTEGPLFKKTLLYAIPIMLTSMLQIAFNAADLMIVGSAGERFVGAVGATGVIVGMLLNLFLGLSGGVSVAVAHAIGEKNNEKTEKVVHTSILLAFVCGVAVAISGLFISRPLLELLKTDKELIDFSEIYLKIYFLGMPANLVYNVGASIIRSAGDTKRPLIYLTVAGVVNVVLNYIFIKYCNMSVDGVAYATVLSQILSAVLIMYGLLKNSGAIGFNWRKMKLDIKSAKSIVKIGLPAGIQNSLFSVSNMVVQSSINTLGPAQITGHSAATNIDNFPYMTINSFQYSTITFAGQNIGAKRFDRLKKIYLINVFYTVVIGLCLSTIVLLSCDFLLSLYSVTEGAALEIARKRFICMSIPSFLSALIDVTAGMLRALGSSTLPMTIYIIGTCALRVVWIYTIFEYFKTPESIYINYPVTWVLTLAALVIALVIVYKKRTKASEN